MSLLASRCTIVRPRSRNALFFFNDTATTEIYTLSLHDALPISPAGDRQPTPSAVSGTRGRDHHHVAPVGQEMRARDRKSTRLNSSHGYISYAVFCLKKKKKKSKAPPTRSNTSFS